MKRKTRIIVLSSILSILAVMIILASTVFLLNKVEVNYLSTSHSVLSAEDAKGIVEAGKFGYGRSNILFTKFDKQIERIEKAYPYAKVEKIERKFPNSAIIHISERTPAAYVKSGQYVYVVDAELKVLDVVYANEYLNGTAQISENALLVPEINLLEVPNGTNAGTKIVNDKIKTILSAISEGMAKSGKSMTLLSKISLAYDDSNALSATFEFDDKEMTLIIKGETNLTRKVQVGVQAYFINLEEHTTGVVEQISESNINFVWQA